MAMIETLYQAAMALPESERAELADRLLNSLDPPPASQLHPAWKAELARRSAELDGGTATPIPWEEVRRQAWEAVDQAGTPPHG